MVMNGGWFMIAIPILYKLPGRAGSGIDVPFPPDLWFGKEARSNPQLNYQQDAIGTVHVGASYSPQRNLIYDKFRGIRIFQPHLS